MAPTTSRRFGSRFMQIAASDASTSLIDSTAKMSCHQSSSSSCPRQTSPKLHKALDACRVLPQAHRGEAARWQGCFCQSCCTLYASDVEESQRAMQLSTYLVIS